MNIINVRHVKKLSKINIKKSSISRKIKNELKKFGKDNFFKKYNFSIFSLSFSDRIANAVFQPRKSAYETPQLLSSQKKEN